MTARITATALALAICILAFAALAETGRTVSPVDGAIDVENLPDGVYPAAFERSDMTADATGIVLNHVHIYTRDRYDDADVDALRVGDTIIVEGEGVEVLTLRRDAFGVTVNEDQDARAFYLVRSQTLGGCVVRGMNDLGAYTEQGVAALAVAEGATFTDGWDIEKEPVTVDYEGIAAALAATENDSFVPDNTSVRVEGGRIAQIVRAYMP